VTETMQLNAANHCYTSHTNKRFFIFDNPEGQWPMWATYLHTRAMFNIWHWQKI